jgi:hypothetical protein
MVPPTEKRVYLTRHAQAVHKYVLIFDPWVFASSKQLRRYSVTCNRDSECLCAATGQFTE